MSDLERVRLQLDQVRGAVTAIDPVFLDTPALPCPPLGHMLGCSVTLKVETLNPVRSFKERGTETVAAVARRIGASRVVCAGLVVEPSAALGIAAVLEQPERFAGRRVTTILCGSNVDPADFARWVLEPAARGARSELTAEYQCPGSPEPLFVKGSHRTAPLVAGITCIVGPVGSWGVASFQNDAAADWFLLIEEAVDPGAVMASAIDDALSAADHLEGDVSCEAIAAAELCACCAGHPPDRLPDNVDGWCRPILTGRTLTKSSGRFRLSPVCARRASCTTIGNALKTALSGWLR